MIVAVLLLTGCDGGGEEEPTNGSTVTVEPTETGSEDETTAGPEPYPLPERPEAMDNDDLDGAEAAGVFFVELLYYSLATGDLELWDAMSGQTCNFCAIARDDILDVYETGGWFEVASPQFHSATIQISSDERADYIFEARVSDPPITQYDRDGEILVSDPGGELQARALLSLANDGWLVQGFEAEDVRDEG